MKPREGDYVEGKGTQTPDGSYSGAPATSTAITYDFNTGKPLAQGQEQSKFNTQTGQQIVTNNYDPTKVTNPTGASSSRSVLTNKSIDNNIGNATDAANGTKTPLSTLQNNIMNNYGLDENDVRNMSSADRAQFAVSIKAEDAVKAQGEKDKADQQAAYQSDLAQSSAEYAKATSDLNAQKEKDLNKAKTTAASLNPYSGANTDEDNYSGSINNEYSKLQANLDSQARMAKAALASGNYKALASINANINNVKQQGLAKIQSLLGDMQKNSNAQQNVTFDNLTNFLAKPGGVPSTKDITSMSNEQLLITPAAQMMSTLGYKSDVIRQTLLGAAKEHEINLDNKSSLINSRESGLALQEKNLALQQDKINYTQSGENPLTVNRWMLASNRLVQNNTVLKTQLKNLGGASGYLSRIEAAKDNPGSVGDQELLDAFTQLNTGGNRVTEAQVNIITKGKSTSDWFKTIQQKIDPNQKGGGLSPDQRQQILDLSKAVYQKYQNSYVPTYQKYVSQAKAAGIPEAYWTIPSPDSLSGASDPDTVDKGTPTTGSTSSGVTWTIE